MRREVFDRYTSKIIIFALLAVTLGCGMWLVGEESHAETTSANATVTVAEACTMTATVDSAHSAMVNPGQYVSEKVWLRPNKALFIQTSSRLDTSQ